MHPELQHTIKAGLSIPEVIKVFSKHHSGPIEEYISGDLWSFEKTVHSDSLFWDKWKPLNLRIGQTMLWDKPWKAMDPFLSIYKGQTQEIISWLCDSERRSNICLAVETQRAPYPIEIPTSANIIASICCDADRLGAQPYYSSIGQITSQLAARYPPYRRILAKRLVDNPRILELPTRVLFKKLIYEPWKVVQDSNPEYIAAPPVIVLHWNADRMNEIFSSICEFSLYQRSSSLLWIISVDRNVKIPIRDLMEPLPRPGIVRFPVRYDDGPSDAALILHHGFSDLRQKYGEMFHNKEQWPSDDQMPHLIRVVSGVFESIDVIIEFVDREEGGGPRAHLETLLSYIADAPSPSDEQPYCALDHFFTRAFLDIPRDLLPTVNQILGVIYYSVDRPAITPLQFAFLLSIDKNTILSAFAYLSGWALTGTERWYPGRELFRRFLKDPRWTGQVWHDPKSGFAVLETYLHFLGYSSNLLGFLESRVQSIPANPYAYDELERLRRIISRIFYMPDKAFHRVILERILALRFDFRCLAYNSDTINAWEFVFFLHELHQLDKVNSPNVVRVEPAGPKDRQFIDTCKGLAGPWDIEGGIFPLSPRYVLLGYEDETVLVLLDHAGQVYKQRAGMRIDIYTSAML